MVWYTALVRSLQELMLLIYYILRWEILYATAVDSDAANDMMDLIRDKYVNGDLSAVDDDESGIKIVGAEEFS
jgi:hypothetical protein